MADTNYGNVPSSGITKDTPDNIVFGAGTIHKGLKYTSETGWNFAESLFGATSGGSKLSITPEVSQVEIDGATVRVKQLDKKTSEKAEMELNFAEMSAAIVKASTFAKEGTSDAEGYTCLESKPDIEEGDYFENISFVGKTLSGKPIIVVFPNAICTSGMELEGKAKEAGVNKCTFECTQDIEGDLDCLPYKIYYPAAPVEAPAGTTTEPKTEQPSESGSGGE